MPRFAYEARDDEGRLTGGLISADSLEQAGQLLSDRNLFVVRLGVDARSEGAVGGGEAGAGTGGSGWRGGASRAQVAWWMSQLSVMVETGIHLSEALDCLARQATDPGFRQLLEDISQNVQEGRSLSDAMAMHPRAFPSSLTALIRASEMSGTMTLVLHRCSLYLMSELAVLKRVRSAIIYPVFMFITCLAVTVFVLTVILPQFADIFAARGATLPLPTRILMDLSQSLLTQWYLWAGGALGLVAAVMLWGRTPLGRRQRDYLAITLPVFSTVCNSLYQSRMFRTMAVLLQSGVSVMDAMQIVREVVSNSYYRDLWAQVDASIRNGERMSGPLLESDLIPEPVAQMIDAGDRSGKLGFVFSRLAEIIEEEYNQAVKTATQFIEPCMILFMGGVIGFVAAALMLPLFQASHVIAQ